MPPFGNPQIKLLEKLCNAIAVSGDEGEVRKIVLEEVEPYADEVKVDALGNVLATRRGSGKKRVRVMLDAHIDEVGFFTPPRTVDKPQWSRCRSRRKSAAGSPCPAPDG